MGYSYATERANLFTERGSEMFIKVRDNVKRLLKESGAFEAWAAWNGVTGDTWLMLACLDRLAEMNEIVQVSPANTRGQFTVYRGVREY